MNNQRATVTPTWRGKPIPPLIAGWFDQLVGMAPIIEVASSARYLDVTLTAASAGNYAKPPQLLIK